MTINKRLLIVGGTGRNVGKTEFVCRVISRICRQLPVYAIKVSSIFPGEELFHGTHTDDEADQMLFEETNKETEKDTSRMLRAGAARVFYLRSKDTAVQAGFREFLKVVPEGAAIISESNSLDQVVQPALAIMVRPVIGQIKPRAVARLQGADLVVVSDGLSGFPELEAISFSETAGWRLNL